MNVGRISAAHPPITLVDALRPKLIFGTLQDLIKASLVNILFSIINAVSMATPHCANDPNMGFLTIIFKYDSLKIVIQTGFCHLIIVIV